MRKKALARERLSPKDEIGAGSTASSGGGAASSQKSSQKKASKKKADTSSNEKERLALQAVISKALLLTSDGR